MSKIIFKDDLPINTIEKFKKKLEYIGLTFTESIFKVSDNIFYVNLLDKQNLGFKVSGKGTTKEYALASAYGEAIERVQCLHFNYSIDWETLSRRNPPNFVYLPDEKVIENSIGYQDIPDVKEDILKKIKYNLLDSDSGNRCNSFLENYFSRSSIYLKFFNYNSNTDKYLPIQDIHNLTGSNGMSSGNTKDESFVQGISEIFERWVEEYIYQNKLTPPEVPMDYITKNYPNIYKIIKQIKDNSGYDSYIYDCSLGKGVPVLCVVFINKDNQRYKKSFGAHPIFEIALERCFTEAFQSSKLEDYYSTSYLSSYLFNNWDTPNQYLKRYNNHSGAIPIHTFFNSSPSWEFTPWGNIENFSNEEEAKNLKELCVKLGFNLYYRYFNFLGVPSCYIYIPKVSMTQLGYDFLSDSSYSLELLFKTIEDNQILDLESKEYLILSLENNYIYHNTLDLNSLLLSLYIDTNKYEKAINLIHNVFNNLKDYDCLVKELELKQLGIPIETRNNILSKFFKKENIDFIESFFRKENSYIGILKKFIQKKTNKESIYIDNIIRNIKELIQTQYQIL